MFSMLIVHLVNSQLFQNVCIVREKITQIGGIFLESRSLVLKKRRQRKHIQGKTKLW
jgi:hypothetical protein